MNPGRTICALLILLLAACGSGSSPEKQDTGGSDTTLDVVADSQQQELPAPDLGGPDLTVVDTAMVTDVGGEDSKSDDVKLIASCSEINSTICFSNLDCTNAGDRCENAGGGRIIIPCCVPGARGKGKPGDACKSENDCESAVCINDLCSGSCKNNSECPTNMSECTALAGVGPNYQWCFPKN